MFAKPNPYIAGNPIKDQAYFFGREDILREVKYVLNNSQNNAITLYGQRRIGKTSILLQLEKTLSTEGDFTPIYFDWHAKPSKDLSSVLYELSQTITTATQQQDIEPIRNDPSGQHFRDVFLPSVAKSTRRNGLVLLCDEVDTLDDQASASLLPYLQTLMPRIEQIKYIFTLGRRPESLPPETLAVFKGVRSARVSLLSPKDTVSIVLQSEQAQSLLWESEALNHVWKWTKGHPFLTQLLCSVVWEQTYETNPSTLPKIQPLQVDAAITKTIEQGMNAFHWIWNGLPPAERVMLSTIAEADTPSVTPEKIEQVLNNSGVRLIVRELKLAPENLVEWELLKVVENGYQFTVPLFKLWVVINRPLRRVKDELDRIDPLAETLFQASQSFYRMEQLDNSEAQLRQAIRINPNHLGAHLLLGRVLLETQRFVEAVTTLEEAYRFDEGTARPDLVRALIALANIQNDEERKLSLYTRILQCDPQQPIAKEQAQKMWLARGEQFFKAGDLDAALTAFTYTGSQPHIQRVHQAKVQQAMERAQQLESVEDWQAALNLYENLRTQYGLTQLDDKIAHCSQQMHLSRLYEKALEVLQQGKRSLAAVMLSEIIAHQPNYKDASIHLVRAVRGPDADKFVGDLLADATTVHMPASSPMLTPIREEAQTATPEISEPAAEIPTFEEQSTVPELFNFLAAEDAEPEAKAAAPETASPESASESLENKPQLQNTELPDTPFILALETEDDESIFSKQEKIPTPDVKVSAQTAAPVESKPPAPNRISSTTAVTKPLNFESAETRWQLMVAAFYGVIGTMIGSLLALIVYAIINFTQNPLKPFLFQPTGIFITVLFVLILPTLVGVGIAFYTFRRSISSAPSNYSAPINHEETKKQRSQRF